MPGEWLINLKFKPEELSKCGGAYYSDVACNVSKSIIINFRYNNNSDYKIWGCRTKKFKYNILCLYILM